MLHWLWISPHSTVLWFKTVISLLCYHYLLLSFTSNVNNCFVNGVLLPFLLSRNKYFRWTFFFPFPGYSLYSLSSEYCYLFIFYITNKSVPLSNCLKYLVYIWLPWLYSWRMSVQQPFMERALLHALKKKTCHNYIYIIYNYRNLKNRLLNYFLFPPKNLIRSILIFFC